LNKSGNYKAERRFLKKYVFALKKEPKPRIGLHSWDPYEYITLIIGVVFVFVIAGWLIGDYIVVSTEETLQYNAPEMLAFDTPAASVDTPVESITEEKPEADQAAVTKKPATKPVFKVYQARRGDTVEKVARRYKIRQETLLAANPKVYTSELKSGSTLRIPVTDGIFYKVTRRDTLFTIAKRHGVTVESIKKYNNLDGSRLARNQELLLPGVKATRTLKTEPVMLAKATPAKNKPVIKMTTAFVDEVTISEEDAAKIEEDADSRIAATTSGFQYPANGKLTSRFGYRKHPMGGGVRMHRGVDIAAATGTPVHATKSGKVLFAGRYGLMGNTIIIQHENGYSSYYGHLSRIDVSKGDTVSAGQLIAGIGSTGLSTGPHLHFEVRRNNVPLDPLKALK